MGRKVTAADIQVEIAKGAFRPHTALSNMALSYFQSDKNYFARTIFPMCPVSLSADNYYIFSKEDLLRDSWKRKPAYGKVEPAVLGENGQTYACQVDQMIVGIDQIRQTDLIRRQGPSIRDPRQQRTRMIATQANIHQDVLFAKNFFKAGSVGKRVCWCRQHIRNRKAVYQVHKWATPTQFPLSRKEQLRWKNLQDADRTVWLSV